MDTSEHDLGGRVQVAEEVPRAGASPEPSLPQTVVQLRHLLAIVKQGVILIGGHHILDLVIVHDLIDPPVHLRVDDVGCDGELEKVEHFEAVEEDATEVLAIEFDLVVVYIGNMVKDLRRLFMVVYVKLGDVYDI